MRKLRNKKSKIEKMGQSVAEYSILISVIAAALLAMNIYMKRGIQATIKYSADQFGSQSDWVETDPDKVMQQNIDMQSLSEASTRVQQDGFKVTTTMNESSSNTGTATAWQEGEL